MVMFAVLSQGLEVVGFMGQGFPEGSELDYQPSGITSGPQT